MFRPERTPWPTRPACSSMRYHQPMHRVRRAGLLWVGPVDAAVRRALLWIQEVVIGLGAAVDELELFAEVGAQRHDDPSAQRDNALLLALAEDGELSSREVEFADADAADSARRTPQ